MCQECQANRYCPGGQAVNACPAHTNSLPGSYKRSHCTCSAGFHGTVSVLKKSKEAECKVCPANFHCPGGAEALPCPANSASAAGAWECQCVAGFFNNELGECQECAPGFWCPGGGVMNACPENSNSTLGSMQVSDCSCISGFFQPWPADDEQQGEGPHCAACYAGAYCLGGQLAVPCSMNSNSVMSASSPDQCVCNAGYHGAGSTGCEVCAKGYYCPGGVNPVECPEKSLSSAGASTVGQCECVPGYTGTGGMCSICPAGSYCAGGKSVLHCPDKSTSDEGASKCACAPGYRGSDPYACTACPSDEYCPGDGQEAPCPANTHSTTNAKSGRECACAKGFTGSGGTDCSACAAGTYCPEVGGEVRSCPANSMSDLGSSAAAQCACKSGFYDRRGYSNALAGPDCELCPAGFYCTDGEKKSCPAKMASKVGSIVLDDCTCVPGHYRDGKECKVCPEGHYCVGDAEKEPCPGVSTSDAGAVSDAQCKCVAGQYGNPKDETGCVPCEAGSFCLGGTDMKTCPAGSTSDAGVSECRCAAGFYGSDWRKCETCPANKYCPGGRTAFSCPDNAVSPLGASSVRACLCVTGYMPVTTANTDLRCEKCVAGSYCPGDSVVKQCPPGKTSNPGAGALRSCGCGEGYYDSGTVPASNFAWIYDGKVKIRAGGLYQWCIQSSDGSRLTINGEVAVNNDGIHERLTRCVKLQLEAGHAAVTVQGFKAVGKLLMRLTLRGPDTDNKEVVPQSDLYESSAGGGSGWRVRVYAADHLLVKIPDMSSLQQLGDTSVDKIDVDDAGDFEDLVPGSCALCSKGHFCPGAFPSSDIDPKAHEIRCPGARFSSAPGASSISDCNACRPGYLGTDFLHCTPCPKDKYCPGGDLAMHCPAGSVTRGPKKHSIRHCVCDKGYERKAGRVATWSCEACRKRHYCPNVGGDVEVCPGNASSPLGSTEISACKCDAGQYDVGSLCKECTAGYFCSGDGERSYCGPLADSPAGSTSVTHCKTDDQEEFFPDKYEGRLPTCELQQCSKTWLGTLMRSCRKDTSCRGVTMESGTLNGWGCKAVGLMTCFDSLAPSDDVVPKVFYAKRRDLQEKDSVALMRRMGLTVPECPKFGQPAVFHQFCSPHARFRPNAWKGLLWKGAWSSLSKQESGGCDDDVQLCTNSKCNVPSNALSSVDIPSGLEVHLFSEPGFEGDELVLYGPMDADDKCLGDMARKRACAVVIDVRTKSEWDEAHVSCASRLEIQKKPDGWQTKVASLTAGDKSKRIIVYCHSGIRAAAAKRLLEDEGYTAVTNGGGFVDSVMRDAKKLEKVCAACGKVGNRHPPQVRSGLSRNWGNVVESIKVLNSDGPPKAEEEEAAREKAEEEEEAAAAAAQPPPALPPPPPPGAGAADAGAAAGGEGTCPDDLCQNGKSGLNDKCAQFRDGKTTLALAQAKDLLADCMAADCVQSLEAGGNFGNCRFTDPNGFCYASSAAQKFCEGEAVRQHSFSADSCCDAAPMYRCDAAPMCLC